MKLTFAKKLFAAAMTAAALLGAAPAHAAVYNGSWDPAYGSAFASLGWRGDITFSVDSACLTTASAYNACAAGQAQISAVTVEFYDLSAPATTLQSFSFGPLSAVLNGIYLDASKHVIGLDTATFASFTPSITLDGVNGYGFYLKFLESGATLIAAPTGSDLGNCYLSPALCSSSHPSNETKGPGVFLNITAVPEPGSYALFGVGMLGLWVIRRRRHQA
jgi:hypothetical protein